MARLSDLVCEVILVICFKSQRVGEQNGSQAKPQRRGGMFRWRRNILVENIRKQHMYTPLYGLDLFDVVAEALVSSNQARINFTDDNTKERDFLGGFEVYETFIKKGIGG